MRHRQLGRSGGQAEVVGVAGVHPGQERGDQLLVHLVTEAPPDEVPHRQVALTLRVTRRLTRRRLGGVEVLCRSSHAFGGWCALLLSCHAGKLYALLRFGKGDAL